MAVAVLVLTAGCGTSDGSPGRETGSATSSAAVSRIPSAVSGCPDLVVLGARGQGQSARADRGVGREVLVTFRALRSDLPAGTTVRLRAVRYPAGSEASYDADVATGVRMIARAKASLAQRCPSSAVALIGFSEGAQVVHLAATPDRFDLVVLMGDPLRNPRLHVRTLSFGTRLGGRGNAGYGAAFADPGHVVEACVAGDDVCNAPLGGRVGGVSATHRAFYERPSTSRAVGRVAAAALE